MRIPPRQVQALTEFAREIAKCECGGILEFDTDLNGYVVESCVKCHFKRAMRPARPRPELDPMPITDSEYPCIEDDCSRSVAWSGTGPRKRRCTECTNERQRSLSREWQRKHKKNGRAA